MSEPGEDSHPAEFDALYRTDAVELAALAFGKTFADATLAEPRRELAMVERAVAELGGVDLYSGWFGSAKGRLTQQLQPYSLEVILLWEQARVAAQQTIAGQYGGSYVNLLRRGELLLQTSDPVGALRGFLPGAPLR